MKKLIELQRIKGICLFWQVCILGVVCCNLLVFWYARSVSCTFWSVWNGPRSWGLPAKVKETTWRYRLCFSWIWWQQTQLARCSYIQGEFSFPPPFCFCCSSNNKECPRDCSSDLARNVRASNSVLLPVHPYPIMRVLNTRSWFQITNI